MTCYMETPASDSTGIVSLHCMGYVIGVGMNGTLAVHSLFKHLW